MVCKTDPWTTEEVSASAVYCIYCWSVLYYTVVVYYTSYIVVVYYSISLFTHSHLPTLLSQLIRLEELVLTHINNPNKRRAGRSTSRATIDWTSISQVTPCQCCCCCFAAALNPDSYISSLTHTAQLMERPYMDCKGKWKKVKAFSMKKGECSSSSGSSTAAAVVGVAM